ncbi:MAG: hypothetical protein II534_08595 [Clostridia bacterium]|nr:hypothetical protein [Clostridia bacterium]
MFLIKKEVEKPNYAKIVGITLGIIAGIAAVGCAVYVILKKYGIKCRLCKSCDCDNCDFLDEDDFSDDDSDVEVEVEDAEN